jgi:ATP-dependent protease ClpP protease subunit
MLSKHTGQSMEVIDRDTDRDNFMSAEEAVNLRSGRQGADRVAKA